MEIIGPATGNIVGCVAAGISSGLLAGLVLTTIKKVVVLNNFPDDLFTEEETLCPGRTLVYEMYEPEDPNPEFSSEFRSSGFSRPTKRGMLPSLFARRGYQDLEDAEGTSAGDRRWKECGRARL